MSRATPDPNVHTRFLSNPTKVAYTGTQGRTAKLTPGLYYLTSDQDCYILQGSVTVAATAGSVPLWANTYLQVRVKDIDGDGADAYFSGIQVTTGGTLWAIPAKV